MIVSTYSPVHEDDTIEIIEALQAQSSQSFELLILVDTDQELFHRYEAYVQNKGYRNVRCIFNPENKGLSFSRNLGIYNAKGKIILYLDDDAVPDADWVAETERSFQEHDVGAATGTILPQWEHPADDWFPVDLYWMISCSYSQFPTEFGETERGFGANMAFRKETLDVIGTFNEELGIRPGKWVGGEDSEMFMRVLQSGNRVIYNPKAIVHHKIPHSRLKMKNLMKRAFDQGYTIATMEKSPSYSLGNKTTEHSYLRSLVVDFLPQKIREFNRRALRQIITVGMVVIFTGFGYIRGFVVSHDS